MTILVALWIVEFLTSTEAVQCHYMHHCSDCDRELGDCLTECDTGYFDRKCMSVCSRICRNNTCMLSEDGSDNCTYGCVLGYYGIGCNIPCESPGDNCTACPGGCDGGYCQLGSSCVSGCVHSYYGTDCESGVGLSAGLATASVLVIFIVVLVVCWCCRDLRQDRFQLYVTPIQGIHAPTENTDTPRYAFVDEAREYDVPSCQGKPANPGCSIYELDTNQHHVS